MPAGMPDGPPHPMDLVTPTQGVKVSVWTFASRNHTILSLWFAGRGEMPCVAAPGCCCVCMDVGAMTRRHRVFLFLFTVVASFEVTLETTVYLHSGAWSFFIAALVILPVTCWLRSLIPALSPKLNAPLPARCTRILTVEEALLATLFLYVLGRAIGLAGQDVVLLALGRFTYTWLTSMAIELVVLVCLYPVLKYCCCCCRCIIPKQYEAYDGA